MRCYQELLDKFYNKYNRAPTSKEFNILTGDENYVVWRYYSYGNFLKHHNYEPSRSGKTYEVIDSDGNVIFSGTARDVADEFDVLPSSVSRCANAYKSFMNKYKIVIKEFDGL